MGIQLKPIETDAIGEVMNISMGAAATAVSTMLDKQVTITTPRVRVCRLDKLEYDKLDPALVVKITYTEGISGSNVMVLKQKDMQTILNQLMGIDDPPSDDFVFDDLSISAACEIMNQMMGSSATALSNFLGLVVNISTPTAEILESRETFLNAVGLEADSEVLSILFTLHIGKVMDSEFMSVVSENLAREIIKRFLKEGDQMDTPVVSARIDSMQVVDSSEVANVIKDTVAVQEGSVQEDAPISAPATAASQENVIMEGDTVTPQENVVPGQGNNAAPQNSAAQQPQQNMPEQAMQTPNTMGAYMGGYRQQMMYPPMYPYPQYPQMYAQPMQPVSVSPVQLSELSQGSTDAQSMPIMYGNMGLIMNVPLSVSVEIGSAKRKIKDIMEFNQGTVIELDKQAGAPVDIVVNGQLFARGDVVVLDDNFGVRITEIIGTKELLDSLEKGTAV